MTNLVMNISEFFVAEATEPEGWSVFCSWMKRTFKGSEVLEAGGSVPEKWFDILGAYPLLQGLPEEVYSLVGTPTHADADADPDADLGADPDLDADADPDPDAPLPFAVGVPISQTPSHGPDGLEVEVDFGDGFKVKGKTPAAIDGFVKNHEDTIRKTKAMEVKGEERRKAMEIKGAEKRTRIEVDAKLVDNREQRTHEEALEAKKWAREEALQAKQREHEVALEAKKRAHDEKKMEHERQMLLLKLGQKPEPSQPSLPSTSSPQAQSLASRKRSITPTPHEQVKRRRADDLPTLNDTGPCP